jgi:hypothetical protein
MRSSIALICTVWGAEFCDFFCQYSLATLLSPTNLPRAREAHDFTLLLYTGQDDLGRIQAHPNFRKLATLIDVKPILLETLPPAARSGHWIQWHHALLSSDRFASFILLIPDCLYANDALPQIANALQKKDVVFYCIPQVCIEPLVAPLQSALNSVDGDHPYAYLDFSEQDIASLFVKFVNPRYAVALHKPDYFVTHPEYILRASKGQIDIHELTCHALAVSSRAKSISYAFNPMSDFPNKAFLGLLAIGVEYTFKYFEQYYRWPASGMQLSRYTTLASWSYSFFERGITDYNNTKTEIVISGLAASTQRRAIVSDPRVKYTRAAFEFYATLYAIQSGPAAGCPPAVKQAIALAMSLPGFRKIMMGQTGPVTILLPASDDARNLLEVIYGTNDPQLLFKFMLMHVLPGRLMLKPGHTFLLESVAAAPNYRRRFRIADPALTEGLSAAVTGRVVSQATYVNDDLIAYTANIRYGSALELTHALMDQVAMDFRSLPDAPAG